MTPIQPQTQPGSVPQPQPGVVPQNPPVAATPPQAVYVQAQPVAAPPVAPSTQQQVAAEVHRQEEFEEAAELRIYSHSFFFYWWPVWVVGFIMAAITRLDGVQVQIGDSVEWFHLSKNVGVVFTLVLFLTIIITNVVLRGWASFVVILAVLFVIVLFAYLNWWETVLRWLGALSIHANMGFYTFFSSLILLVWLIATFVFDRLHYWKIRPGQITQETVIGAAEKSFDTRGMVFEKHREDLFRHWVLGLGSGDLRIHTMGAKREEIYVPNVLFVDAKVAAIQRMIAVKPDKFITPTT
jgi:hypothetical protein